MALLRDRTESKDDWVLLQSASGPEALAALRGRKIILPLGHFLSDEEGARDYAAEIGVWLDSHESLDSIKSSLHRLPLIALNFPIFSDGRHYSSARALRQEHGFGGEIRAIGDVLRDQLCFMERCGFNAFALRADQSPAECLAAFDDFSTSYSPTALEDQPLFRRRL